MAGPRRPVDNRSDIGHYPSRCILPPRTHMCSRGALPPVLRLPLPPAQSLPMASLRIPDSVHTVRLRAIDATTHICCSSKAFIQPVLPGFDVLNLASITFLVEHSTLDRKVLFDCGARKDFENFSPVVKKRLNLNVRGLKIDRNVHDIVREAGITLDSLDAMIWSHWHWDHHGAPEQYPSTVDIVVGPGFKEAFLPGYPTNPDAIFCDANFA